MGYARIHVFPYSPREDTPAAAMPGQLSPALKEQRARELIALGEQVARRYLESWLNQETVLLPEEKLHGCWEGYTPPIDSEGRDDMSVWLAEIFF
jgi:threonylcarbamoyladenosine tRNA methylthiotransferase MtaB